MEPAGSNADASEDEFNDLFEENKTADPELGDKRKRAEVVVEEAEVAVEEAAVAVNLFSVDASPAQATPWLETKDGNVTPIPAAQVIMKPNDDIDRSAFKDYSKHLQ